jgi:hypothetical protein
MVDTGRVSIYVSSWSLYATKIGAYIDTHNYCRALGKFLVHKLEFIIIEITIARKMLCLKG